MTITLGTLINSIRTQRHLAEHAHDLSKVFERLSSGQRINKASDDAAGLAMADSLRADAKVFNRGVRNLNDGLSLFNIADSAIEALSSIVIRLEELATQAANGIYGPQQRKAIDAEAQSLSDEFFRISKTTEFNGLKLFTGELSELTLQAGYSVIEAGIGGALGNATFAPFTTITTANGNQTVVTGDFNGDGFSDLAVGQSASGEIHIFLGQGNGSFSETATYSTGPVLFRLRAGDFDNDGVLDLAGVVTSENAVYVLMGVGNGSFSTATSFSVGGGPEALAVEDLNADGLDDIIVSNVSDNTLSIMLALGGGTFAVPLTESVGAEPKGLTTGDFNGDGIIDIASANRNSDDVSVLLGLGNGDFGSASSFSAGNNPFAITSADFNGDGVLDLAVTNRLDDSIGILLGQGNGTFASQVSYSVGSQPGGIAAADFNGDGFIDLASADRATDNISILLNQGDGTFSSAISIPTGDQPRDLAAADFNGDGVFDLVTPDINSDSISIHIGKSIDGIAPLLPFSLLTLADARQALPVFSRKREQLAVQRGEIGAHQARIDVAVNVLEVASENFRSAESRIRDADVAEEAAKLTRLNILQQASAAILAQANQQPALALQLIG